MVAGGLEVSEVVDIEDGARLATLVVLVDEGEEDFADDAIGNLLVVDAIEALISHEELDELLAVVAVILVELLGRV